MYLEMTYYRIVGMGRLLQTRAFPLPITPIVVDPTEMKLFSGGKDY